MYKDKTIGVVVPAYNEEKLIGGVIDTMHESVDKIIIVNDKSTDNTRSIVENLAKTNKKVILVPASEIVHPVG